MSGLANFHSKMSDFYIKELSPELISINYGLANGFSASLIEVFLLRRQFGSMGKINGE
jgi:phage FluMu protein gp41